MFIGTFLLTMILLSQSVVASGNYAQTVVVESYVTDSGEALGSEDDDHASLGIDSPPTMGSFVLDFSSNIPGSSDLWIHANSSANETYRWRLLGTRGTESSWTSGFDTKTIKFTTPAKPSPLEDWNAIEIESVTANSTGDPHYGAEIDAVEF
jgi:hypothetical protein